MGTEGVISQFGLLPRDRGAEALAMIDGIHLLEWISPLRYDITESEVTGTSEFLGDFVAELHPVHRFVTVLRAGSCRSEVVLELEQWRVSSEPIGSVDR